jgi:hypothetical protein
VASCCKQTICTDCYTLLKKSTTQKNHPCPFCSNTTLTVVYTPSSKDNINLSDKNTSQKLLTALEFEKNGSSFSSPSSICKDDEGYETTRSNGNDSSSISTTSSRQISDCNVQVPLSSITDRKDIEAEIQGQRLRYADDQPTPLPSRSRESREHVPSSNSFYNTLARRNYLSSSSDYNTSRGTMSDLEHAALRLRFAVAMGESSQERYANRFVSPTSRARDSMRGHDETYDQFEGMGDIGGRRGNNDLERIEEMMMMEVTFLFL